MVDCKFLGQNIRKYRIEASLSQDELAETCGCCGSFIGKIENGRSLPSLDMIVKIANALNVTVDQLLLDSPYKAELTYMREIDERINRLPPATRIEVCKSLSDLMSIIEGLHN